MLGVLFELLFRAVFGGRFYSEFALMRAHKMDLKTTNKLTKANRLAHRSYVGRRVSYDFALPAASCGLSSGGLGAGPWV